MHKSAADGGLAQEEMDRKKKTNVQTHRCCDFVSSACQWVVEEKSDETRQVIVLNVQKLNLIASSFNSFKYKTIIHLNLYISSCKPHHILLYLLFLLFNKYKKVNPFRYLCKI